MPIWTRESVIAKLNENDLGYEVRDIAHGVQFKLPQGTPIDLYEGTGKLVIRGKKCDERNLATNIFESITIPKSTTSPTSVSPAIPAQVDDRVFIVYGHDTSTRDSLELMLLRMNLKPVILSNMAPEGKTIIEALMANTNVKYAVVLLTPDDEGHKLGQPNEKKARARQNVVLELGMFLSALGRDKVAILHKGDLELPSDINGLIYISFQNSVQEAKNKLAASLQKAGFYIDINSLSAE